MKIRTTIMIMIFTIVYMFYSTVNARTVKIAVIDTGYDFNSTWVDAESKGLVKPKLCKTGHKDFTDQGIQDKHNHGTHISGLIAKYANNMDYCLVIIKYYHGVGKVKYESKTSERSALAISWAIGQGVDIINYSGGGAGSIEVERKFTLQALNSGIIFVAASGNERSDLAQYPFYPASYDKRVIVVNNVDKQLRRHPTSNYGHSVDVEVMGTDILSLYPNNKYGKFTGSSQGTAIISGQIVKQLYMKSVFRHTPEFFGNVSTDNYLFQYERYVAH